MTSWKRLYGKKMKKGHRKLEAASTAGDRKRTKKNNKRGLPLREVEL